MINKKIITTLAILLFNLSAINVAYAAAKIGELNFGNKAKYIGEVKNGKAHGIGALKTVDGNNYIGNFSRNIVNGEGILIKLHADGKLADLKINDNFPQLNKSQIQGALTDFRDRWVNLKQVEDQITYNTDQDEGFFTKLKVQRQNLKKEFFESTYPEWWKGVLKKSNNNEKILLDEIQIFVGKWRYGTHNEYLGKNKNFRRQIKLKKLDQIAEDEKKEDEDEIGDVIEDNIEDKIVIVEKPEKKLILIDIKKKLIKKNEDEIEDNIEEKIVIVEKPENKLILIDIKKELIKKQDQELELVDQEIKLAVKPEKKLELIEIKNELKKKQDQELELVVQEIKLAEKPEKLELLKVEKKPLLVFVVDPNLDLGKDDFIARKRELAAFKKYTDIPGNGDKTFTDFLTSLKEDQPGDVPGTITGKQGFIIDKDGNKIQVDIGSWDTSNVTNMSDLFNQDIGSEDDKKPTKFAKTWTDGSTFTGTLDLRGLLSTGTYFNAQTGKSFTYKDGVQLGEVGAEAEEVNSKPGTKTYPDGSTFTGTLDSIGLVYTGTYFDAVSGKSFKYIDGMQFGEVGAEAEEVNSKPDTKTYPDGSTFTGTLDSIGLLSTGTYFDAVSGKNYSYKDGRRIGEVGRSNSYLGYVARSTSIKITHSLPLIKRELDFSSSYYESNTVISENTLIDSFDLEIKNKNGKYYNADLVVNGRAKPISFISKTDLSIAVSKIANDKKRRGKKGEKRLKKQAKKIKKQLSKTKSSKKREKLKEKLNKINEKLGKGDDQASVSVPSIEISEKGQSALTTDTASAAAAGRATDASDGSASGGDDCGSECM